MKNAGAFAASYFFEPLHCRVSFEMSDKNGSYNPLTGCEKIFFFKVFCLLNVILDSQENGRKNLWACVVYWGSAY